MALNSFKNTDMDKIKEYLEKRINELNQADAVFCEDRWDMSKPKIERDLYREQSNNVTFARQELQRVQKFINELSQTASTGSLPYVRVLMIDGSFVKGKVISLNGPKKQGVELKIDEKCLVEIEKNQADCHQVNVIEIEKKYISDWRQ